MTNKNKRKQKKAQQAAAEATTSNNPTSATMPQEVSVKTTKVDLVAATSPEAFKDDDRPIRGWHDVLELAAEYGLVPVGPTL